MFGLQVGIHSALANKLMKQLLHGHHVPGLHAYAPGSVQPEVAIQPFLQQVKKRDNAKAVRSAPGKTRIDFQIQHDDDSYTFVEVKSVTYTQQCEFQPSLCSCQLQGSLNFETMFGLWCRRVVGEANGCFSRLCAYTIIQT
jgi:hypothetical protein